jgi:hypothetical protein
VNGRTVLSVRRLVVTMRQASELNSVRAVTRGTGEGGQTR